MPLEVFPGDDITVVAIRDPDLSAAFMAIGLAIRIKHHSNEAAAIMTRCAWEVADLIACGDDADPEPS